MDVVSEVVLMFVVVLAAITDVASQRVPNWLTLPSTVLALCLHSALGGPAGVAVGVTGWLAGFGLLVGFYVLGGMGAGDVKLLAAIGTFTGPYRVFFIFIYTALFGGIYALGIVVYSMSTGEGWAKAGRSLRDEGRFLLLSGGDVQPLARSLGSYPKLRYAVAMAAGVATEHVFGAPWF